MYSMKIFDPVNLFWYKSSDKLSVSLHTVQSSLRMETAQNILVGRCRAIAGCFYFKYLAAWILRQQHLDTKVSVVEDRSSPMGRGRDDPE